MMVSKALALGVGVLLSSTVIAKDWQVEMLSYGDKGPMVFEPDYIHAEVGDTVTFVPTQPGHHTKSQLTPAGQAGWTSKFNQTYSVELTHEGLSLYFCPPHLMMGMVGVIQVGKAGNQVKFDQAYNAIKDKVVVNPERLDLIKNQIQ
ncbi:MAG: pseudoazurin [Marinomonas atlantica]|nr:pseudoazurin [Marinomonas atlantica]